MKKAMILMMAVCLLMLTASGALAQGITISCEYDDGTSVPITDGATVKSDGELNIRLDGVTEGAMYRAEFSGKSIGGEPFKDYQGFIAGADEYANYIYLLLTDKAGTYGPFDLILTGNGVQETISFSVDVEPNREKDWIAYGVVNNPAMASLPPFLVVDPGHPDSQTMRTARLQILEPADGAVLSGFSFGEIFFDYEILEPDTEMRLKIIDTKTGGTVYEGGDYFPEPENHGLRLDFDYGFAFDREYIFEITDGDSTASTRFTLVEEQGGDAQGAQQIMEARKEMNASYHAENMYESQELDDETRAILDNMEKYKFIQLERLNVQTDEGQIYDWLVEEFNARTGGYATGLNMAEGLYKYYNESDEGGILQSWALSSSSPSLVKTKTDIEDAKKHLNFGMQLGVQLTQVFQQMLGNEMTMQMPLNTKWLTKYAGGNQVNMDYIPIAQATAMVNEGKPIADMMLYAIELNGKMPETHRYILVRFLDPLGDGSQVYTWNIANQDVVKKLISMMNMKQGADNQEKPEDSAQTQQRYVRIRKDGSVNVRQKSNADSKRVGSAKANATYPCLGVAENGWFQIQLEDGTVGFISPKMAKLLD